MTLHRIIIGIAVATILPASAFAENTKTFETDQVRGVLDPDQCVLDSKNGDYRIVVTNQVTAVRSNGAIVFVYPNGTLNALFLAEPLNSNQVISLKSLSHKAQETCRKILSVP